MIRLSYLKRKIQSQDVFYEQFLTCVFPHLQYGTDLIITSDEIRKRPGLSIFHWQEIDLETIVSIKTNNIILTEFDDIDTKFLRSLITLKSKDTEIIGISNSGVKEYKNIQLEIQKFKDAGFTNDLIAISLILKNNIPSKLINKCLSTFRTKLKNINIKEINNI